MPSIRSLAQLRSLLPYAAKLLPVLTGAIAQQPTVMRPDLSSLNRHFGEIQTESRSLRSQIVEQGEQITQMHEQMQRVVANSERIAQEQAALAESFRSLAGLLKGLCFATLFLLIALTVMCGLLLARVPHP